MPRASAAAMLAKAIRAVPATGRGSGRNAVVLGLSWRLDFIAGAVYIICWFGLLRWSGLRLILCCRLLLNYIKRLLIGWYSDCVF